MNVPILKQGHFLICSFQASLSDTELVELQRELARRVGQTRAKAVIIDVTALDTLDSFSTRVLSNTAQMLRLRGAHAMLVGIQPDVASAMARMGLRLKGVRTALDLEDAMAELEQLLAQKRLPGKSSSRCAAIWTCCEPASAVVKLRVSSVSKAATLPSSPLPSPKCAATSSRMRRAAS
jgi:rsbT antagonist protein RsbS